VLSCGYDAQAFLWSLRPPAAASGQEKPSLDALWTALAAEPAPAYRALWQMAGRDAAALRDKLAPVKPVADDELRKLIGDLEGTEFTTRDAATKELARLGYMAIPAMKKALANDPSVELRKRLEELVNRTESKALSGEELRAGRAIDVLERLGTPEAMAVLKGLADGAPGALITTSAKDALGRLQAAKKRSD
jgi:hypothetical protein